MPTNNKIGSIYFTGSTTPTNASTDDLWYDSSIDGLKRYDGSSWLPLYGSFYAHRNGSGVTGLATGDNKIQWTDDSTSPGHDTHGYMDTTNYRFKPTVASKWWICVHVTGLQLSDGKYQIIKVKNQNGTVLRQSGWTPIGAAGDHTMEINSVFTFDGVDDYIEVFFNHNDGDNSSGYYGTAIDTWFTGHRIS